MKAEKIEAGREARALATALHDLLKGYGPRELSKPPAALVRDALRASRRDRAAIAQMRKALEDILPCAIAHIGPCTVRFISDARMEAARAAVAAAKGLEAKGLEAKGPEA